MHKTLSTLTLVVALLAALLPAGSVKAATLPPGSAIQPIPASVSPKGPVTLQLGSKTWCKSYLKIDFCARVDYDIALLRICGKVGGLPYKCYSVLKANCYEINATDLLVNFEMCAKNLQVTKRSASFNFTGKGCVEVWVWLWKWKKLKKCTTLLDERVSVSW